MLITLAFTALIIVWSLFGRIDFDNIGMDTSSNFDGVLCIVNLRSYSVPVVFYVSSCIARVFFLSLAKKWPSLMQQWQDVEDKLPPFESHKDKAMLAFKIKMVSIVVMLLSMCPCPVN